jgi:hypothetical protein
MKLNAQASSVDRVASYMGEVAQFIYALKMSDNVAHSLGSGVKPIKLATGLVKVLEALKVPDLDNLTLAQLTHMLKQNYIGETYACLYKKLVSVEPQLEYGVVTLPDHQEWSPEMIIRFGKRCFVVTHVDAKDPATLKPENWYIYLREMTDDTAGSRFGRQNVTDPYGNIDSDKLSMYLSRYMNWLRDGTMK